MNQNHIQMTVKCLQNTNENKGKQIDWVKNSEHFYKRDASISLHSNLTKWSKYQKVTQPNTKTNSTQTKNQNQINILQKISVEITPK